MAQNALQTILMLEQLESAEANQNYLKKKHSWEEEDRKNALADRQRTLEQNKVDREREEQLYKYQTESTAISAALKAGNQEDANAIYKRLGGMSETGVTVKGDTVDIDYKDSTFSGPASVVAELVDNVSQKPEYMLDPKTISWFASKGGSIKKKEQKAPTTRTIQKGRENVQQEYVNGKWVEVGRGPKDKPSTGMEITTSDGTVIRTNVPQGTQPTKPTKNKVQQKLLDAAETYSNIRSIASQYEEKYLKGLDKIGYFTTAFKEKWNLGQVSTDDKKGLAEYTRFRRDSISSLNEYIKQITGAAMSEPEAKRILKGMPNPGQGLFDGDSPTEFKAKMDGVMSQLDRVIARANYINKNGLKSIKDVGLEQIDGIIDRRGLELEQQIKTEKPDASGQEIEQLVIDALSNEFGIRF